MQTAFPDGISDEHVDERPRRMLHPTWIGLILLGAVIVASLLGAFGGYRNSPLTQSANGVELSLSAPTTLRNGEFFEIRLGIETGRALAAPAIAISSSSFRDLTINTTMPAASSERSEAGMFVFEYEPVAAGASMVAKFDGQANPTLFGGTEGSLELRDGADVLLRVPLRIRVLP